MMKTLPLLFTLSVGVLTSVSALADITGLYRVSYSPDEGGTMSMTVSVRDDRHVRIDAGSDMYTLLKGDKVYSVRREGNRWVAMDLSEMGKMVGGLAGLVSEDDDDAGDGEFRDTGRTETVAGYRGKVFEVIDEGRRTEVVMTDHKDITALSRGMYLIGKQGAESMGFAMGGDLFPGGYNGLLRGGQEMVLVSVDKAKKPAGYFDLPAGVVMQSMPAMPAMPGMGNMGDMLPPGMSMEDLEKQMREAMKNMGR
jgi:hypothetical protein